MKAIALFFTALLAISLVQASPSDGTSISGLVTDSEGGIISNARVVIHWDSAGSTVGLSDNVGIKQDLIVVTDSNGRFSADVPPGFYDLFVTRMAFTPVAAKVRVRKGASAFRAKMFADPLVSEELGDRITAAPSSKR